jgi:DNA-3-methyladenine glycosylase
VYDEPRDDDGFRVLVDRLWPRGLSKQRAQIDVWIKEVAPSTELRHWYGHDPARYEEFRRRYNAELDDNPALEELRNVVTEHRTTTLLHSAGSDLNNATVLLERLERSGSRR